MINVYIEYGACADHVATLQDEWVYMALLPAFQKLAEEHRGFLSESIVEDTPRPDEVYLVICHDDEDVCSGFTVMHVCSTMERANELANILYVSNRSEKYWVYKFNIET